jgi:hypothetical protein
LRRSVAQTTLRTRPRTTSKGSALKTFSRRGTHRRRVPPLITWTLQIRDSNALNAGDFMNSQLQGVSVNDCAGNPFQMDVNYRGFTASPAIGTPEGLSVFFDGVRVNEPFGDVVRPTLTLSGGDLINPPP